MSLDCTTEKYASLYSRWLEKPGDLLDLAQYVPGQKLLDLCGGTGAVTMAALRRGAPPESITLYDLNPRLVGPGTRGVRKVGGKAERIGFMLTEWDTYDVIVCRQAISYIDYEHYPGWTFASSIAALLKPGGKFVFNSFVHPKWTMKTYRHHNRRFLEVSGYVGRWVFHVQASPSLGTDVSLFRWHHEGHLYDYLSQYFHLELLRNDKSLRWICTKR